MAASRTRSAQQTPHELLGRRYGFADRSAPDFTVIAYSTANDSLLAHFRDDRPASKGPASYRVVTQARQYLRLREVLRGIREGVLVESVLAPFVNDRNGTVTVS